MSVRTHLKAALECMSQVGIIIAERKTNNDYLLLTTTEAELLNELKLQIRVLRDTAVVAYAQSHGGTQAAREFGITPSRISQIKKKIKKG